MNIFTDNPEWRWLFKHAVDWKNILPLYYPEFPVEDGPKDADEAILLMEEVLDTTAKWTMERVAPRSAQLDQHGPGEVVDGELVPNKYLKEFYAEASQLNFHGLSFDPHWGGAGMPLPVFMVAFCQVARACQASSSQITFFATMADMVIRFADKEDRERLIPKILEGTLSGSMCLTEADVGSDLGALKTFAIKRQDGLFEITGNKIFITNGGGDFSLVLARIKGAPEGLGGISLFLVERFIEDKDGKRILNYRTSKNEEKMGQHGSFTCEVVYQKSVGKLLGEENKGFSIMLHLMNEARTGVGVQSLGGIEACLAYVREYATTRKQFGMALSELPLYKKNLEEWETERDAIRALMVDHVSYYDIYQRLDLIKRETGELNQAQRKLFNQSLKWVRRRTPLVKYYGSETYVRLASESIKALGGHGYMKDHPLERYLRDSYGPVLYEGTSQIQALMALKDLMKFIMKNPARFFQSIVYSHPLGNIFSEGKEYQKEFSTLQYEFKKNLSTLLVKTLRPEVNLLEVTDLFKIFNVKSWMKEEKFSDLMGHAETLCQAQAYLETLRVLGQHAGKDKNRALLFERYKKLIKPRLAAIYTAWAQS